MPDFVTLVLVPGLLLGCLYSLVTIGFNVAEKTARVLNFAHGSLIMWAPLAALVAWDHWGFPKWLALIFGVGTAVVMAVLIKEIALRPFVGRAVSYQWLLSGLGAAAILDQLAVRPYAGDAVDFPIALSTLPYDLWGIRIAPQQILLVGVVVGLWVALKFLYGRTKLGYMLLAVGEDFDGAQSLGIPPQLMATIAFAMSGVAAAAVGLIAAPYLLVAPGIGFQLLFTGFVALMFGGITSVGGGIIGGLIVGVIIQATSAYIDARWTNIVLFGLLLLLYLVRPQGLFGQRATRLV